jgi:hypothetical protein
MKQLPNTIENVGILVNEAMEMNEKKENDYIAIVDYTEDKNLTIRLVPNTEANQEIANS